MKVVVLRRARIASAVLFLIALVIAAFFAACSSNTPPTDNGGPGGSGSGAPVCTTPAPGCSCTMQGATASCGSTLTENGTTVTCVEGTMACGSDGKWGACSGGTVQTKAFSRGTIRPQGLGTDASACSDPCDPYCESIGDTPQGLDAGDSGLIVTDSGLSLVVSPQPPKVPCTGLVITPSTSTVTLASLSFAACTSTSQCGSGFVCSGGQCSPQVALTATYTPASCYSGAASAIWSVSPASIATVDANGNVTVINPVAGTLNVTAYAGAGADAGLVSASATVNVVINVLDTSRAPDAATPAAFDAGASGVDGLEILYPYQNTVMPLGLLPPTVQWSPGKDGGAVTSITIVDGGSGYTQAPGVVFTGGGGTGAAANATITGSVLSVAVDAGGSGFMSPDGGSTVPVTFSATTGSGATGNATITGTVVTGTYAVTNPGQGYTSVPTVSFTGGGGSGAAATVTTGNTGALTTGTFPTSATGQGYTGPVTVGITGGGGSGATATANLTGQVLTGTFPLTTQGSGYTSAPAVNITGATGTGATATSTLATTGSLTTGTFAVTTPGSSFTTGPVTGTISGSGTGAAATLNLGSTGSIKTGTFAPTAGGSGYTGQPGTPTISFAGGGGTGATGTVTVTGPVSTTNYTITNPGAGYTSVPTVTPGGGGGGTGFAATPTYSVTGTTSLVAGSGYTSAPTITLSSPPSGVQATAQANLSSTGGVTSVSYTPPPLGGIAWGTGLSATPSSGTATFNLTTASKTRGLTSISISTQGTGYTANCTPTITITGGGGSGATALDRTPTTAGGVLPNTSTIVITNPGSGYSSTPTFVVGGCGSGFGQTWSVSTGTYSYISASPYISVGTPGSYATPPTITFNGLNSQSGTPTATATLGYTIASVTITNAGSGYTTPATFVSATGGGGSGFSFVPTSSLSALTITAGSGYTSPPTLTFSGGGATTNATVTLNLNAAVTSITVTAGGSGYGPPATATISGGGGSGATFTPTLLYGGATVTISAGGSGYGSGTTITFPASSGSNYVYTPALNYGVASVTVSAGGSNYSSPLTATLTGGGGTGASFTPTLTKGIASVTIVSGGSGYTSVPTVTFTDPAGSGAAFTPSLAVGVMTINITAGGSGYTSVPTVVFTGGGGSGASYIASITNTVVSVTVTSGGAGYTSPPAVIFGGGGTGAVGTATISGSVSGLAIVAEGQGYTSAPTVSFTGGGGTGAAATCTISTIGGTGVATGVLVSLKYPADGSLFNYSEIVPELDTTYGTPYNSSPIALGFSSSHTSFTSTAWTSFGLAAVGNAGYISVQRLVNGHLYPSQSAKIIFANNQLKGTVYYNTYGTQEVYNYSGVYSGSPNPGTTNLFGAATLAIQPGAATPYPIEGWDTYNVGTCTGEPGNTTGCRVCHSVNANGTRLITQTQNNGDTQSVDVPLPTTLANPPCTNNANEITMGGSGNYDFAGQYPDGSMLLSNAAALAGGSSAASQLWNLSSASTPTLIASNFNSVAGGNVCAGTPAFSPDGSHVAFQFNHNCGGTATIGGIGHDSRSIAVMDFNSTTTTFSNPRLVAQPVTTPSGAAQMPIPSTGGAAVSGVGWYPSFLPDNSNLIFHYETYTNDTGLLPPDAPAGSGSRKSWMSGRSVAETRSQCDSTEPGSTDCHEEGVHSELWYSDLSSRTPRRMNCLNGLVDPVDGSGHQNCANGVATGTSYLPAHAGYSPSSVIAAGNNVIPAGYADDSNLNYEPTVLPVAAGGYAWAVFTSRRAYGNISSSVNPFWSDPRFAPIAPGSGNITPKKLWVAAIDTSVTDTTKDPSHPAFYLDGQELVAGNSRGYWVLNACTPSGSSTTCTSDLDCCTGSQCQLDNPLPSPATSHCVPKPAPGSCVADGANCASNPTCCNAASGAICSQQSYTCVYPPPLPYYQEADFTRLYTSPCPASTRPIWGNFEYGTITPSDSQIIIDVETSNDPTTFRTVDGGTVASTPLVQLPTVVKGATIQYPNGSQNVESALRNAGTESSLYLYVIVRLIPSTDGRSAPSLVQWNQQFDCISAQ